MAATKKAAAPKKTAAQKPAKKAAAPKADKAPVQTRTFFGKEYVVTPEGGHRLKK